LFEPLNYMSTLSTYLSDPFLNELYAQIRRAGSLRSISLDLTHECNLRCTGCYYFEEGMDKIVESKSQLDHAFHELVKSEKERGTNFVTVVGGEPSERLDRLKIVYDNFKMNVATNGLKRIPFKGFEKMPIGVSVWGDHQTDAELRNSGKRDLFKIALDNYKNDIRAFFYYTVTPDKSDEIELVVKQCIHNGNKVLFNYYSDLSEASDTHQHDFEKVRLEIDRMIELFPEHILSTSYFNEVITTGKLNNQDWGYEVCTNVSTNLISNERRLKNGNPFNKHFRSYNADFKTTRRCCTGITRSCDSCFDTWEHFSWIMINMKTHLITKQKFTKWLTTMYMFYYINGLVEIDKSEKIISKIHKLLQLKKVTL
jgi:MoaA/NifB/PqqE/SkfB family radical SAM enzyme